MIINLISGPRNVSTALMYAFAQRSDTKVVDEPFYAYYLAKTGVLHPGRTRIMQAMSTDIHEITVDLMKKVHQKPIIFLKNMAHHHIGINKDFMLFANHLFLIREPGQLLNSFSKVIRNPTLEDIGAKKSWELYEMLRKEGKQPVVLDSGELLKQPANMLSRLCDALSIEYQAKMLSWPAGPIPEDGVWAEYWYHNVHRSTGFLPTNDKAEPVPDGLMDVYEKALPYYERLYEKSIKHLNNAAKV
jgi:hypothetical protein